MIRNKISSDWVKEKILSETEISAIELEQSLKFLSELVMFELDGLLTREAHTNLTDLYQEFSAFLGQIWPDTLRNGILNIDKPFMNASNWSR